MRTGSSRIAGDILTAIYCITLFSTPVWASIPDDINVGKYEKIYRDGKRISDQKRRVANQLNRQVQDLQANIAHTESQIDSTSSAIRRLKNEISDLSHGITRLENDNINLQDQIHHNRGIIQSNRSRIQNKRAKLGPAKDHLTKVTQRLDKVQKKQVAAKNKLKTAQAHLSAKKTQLTQLTKKRAQADQKIKNHQTAIAQITAKIQKLKSDEKSGKTKIPVLTRELNQLKAQAPKAKADVDSIQSKINSLQAQITPINQKIKLTKDTIRQKQRRIRKLRASNDPKKAEKIARLKQEISGEKQKLAALNGRVAPMNQKMAILKQNLGSAKNKVARINNQIQEKTKALQAAKKAVAENSKKIPPLVKSRDQHKAAIPGLKQKKQGLTAQIQKVQPQVQQAQQAQKSAKDDLTAIQTRLSTIKANAQAAQQKVTRLKRRIQRLRRENQQLRQNNSSAQRQITYNNQSIRDMEFRIDENRSQIRRSESTLLSMEQELDQLLRQKSTKVREFNRADQVALAAELDTQSKYDRYISVHRAYSNEFKAAQKQGASQGQPLGLAHGEGPGINAGTLAGKKEGHQFGQQEGLLIGYKEGLETGMSQGKSEGYKAGSEAPANYQKGHNLGFAQGKKDAYALAHKENYFAARAQKKKELLKLVPTDQIEFDNGTAQVSQIQMTPMAMGEPGMLTIMSAPSDGNMIPLSSTTGDSWDDLMALVNSIEGRIQRIPAKAIITPDTGVVTSPISVDMSQAHCQLRYIDFVKACENSFKKEYLSAYKSQYRDSYKSAKIAAFDQSKPEATAKSSSVRVKEGINYAKPIAFTYWNQIGARDAQNKGFSDGKSQGFNHYISQAQAEETQKGLTDEQNYFASNPVVRMLEVDFQKVKGNTKKIKAGTELKLSVLLANFGHKSSKLGQVKVKWEALTNNVEVDDALHPIKAIPAKTKALVHSIAYAKIKPTALLAQMVKLKVTAIHPDGVSESKVISINVDLSFKLKMVIQAEKQVLRTGQNEVIRIKLTNQSPMAPPENIVATMNFPANTPGFKYKKQTNSFGKIIPGKRLTRLLSYRVKRKAKANTTVPITITIKIGPEIISQKVINVKVVKYKQRCDWSDPFCGNGGGDR